MRFPVYTAVLLLTLASGCTQRQITITSAPSGALVHLNDREVGRTPVTVPFRFYGTYDVRLQKAGYEPLWTVGEADPPWWDRPGPDLIAELGKNEVHFRWHYHLTEAGQTPADEAALLERANSLRKRAGAPAEDD